MSAVRLGTALAYGDLRNSGHTNMIIRDRSSNPYARGRVESGFG